MGIALGGGLLHPSLLRVGGQEGLPAPQFLVPGGGRILRKGERVERGHSPQADPCGIVGESFWRLGEQLYSTLVFPALPVPQFPHSSKHICDAKTHALALPAPQHSALKSPGHLGSISAPTFTLPDVPAQAEIAPWFRHCAGGAEPISSPALQSPNKQPNPQAEPDGLWGICHGAPQAASAPGGWQRGDGQGPPAVPVPQAGHFQWGEHPVLLLLGAWVLLPGVVSI